MPGKTSEGGNPLLYLFKKTWKYSEGNRKNVALFWGMFTVAVSITLFLNPVIAAKMMNVIQKDGLNAKSFWFLCLLASLPIAVRAVFWSLHGPARVMENVNAFKVRANYRKYLLKGILTLPMSWHCEHHSGDSIDKIEKGTSAMYQFSRSSFEVLYAIIQLFGSFAVLAYFSPSSIPLVLGMVLISAWITIRFDRVMIEQYRQLNWSENQVSEGMFDTISNVSTVIILRVEKLVFGALVAKIDKPLDLYQKNNRLSEFKWFLTSLCASVMTALVLILFFWQHRLDSSGVLVGSVFILYKYLDEVSEVLFRFTSMYSDIVVQKTKVTNAEELAKDFTGESLSNHVLPKSWHQLEVRNLNFSYHNGKEGLHLDNIFLSITHGERIAFIGESGSGKTTLLKIMRDLYQPQGYRLFVDGIEITNGFEGISRAIALIPQDPEIFATTIRDNITLGAEYSLEDIRQYTDMACFTQVVNILPKKFDSSIKEKGVNLSGGQQQRLALARGLLACRDKDVILLDEPTSSLDIATEMTVYKNIFREFTGKTIISSIHRLHLLPHFDKICLFEDGKIVASGSFKEMIAECQSFQAMWSEYRKELH